MSRTPKEWRELLAQAGDSVHHISSILDDWEREKEKEKEKEKENKEAIFFVDGKECYDENSALATLLEAGHLLVFKNESGLIDIHVNCSDLFAWACADSEPLLFDELMNVYKLRNEKWGIIKWCCRRRNQKPQPPIVSEMKKDGVWDNEMETLPDNTMDAQIQAAFYAAAKNQGLVK